MRTSIYFVCIISVSLCVLSCNSLSGEFDDFLKGREFSIVSLHSDSCNVLQIAGLPITDHKISFRGDTGVIQPVSGFHYFVFYYSIIGGETIEISRGGSIPTDSCGDISHQIPGKFIFKHTDGNEYLMVSTNTQLLLVEWCAKSAPSGCFLCNEMFFQKRSTRTGFEIFFKIECSFFAMYRKIKFQWDRKSFWCSRNLSMCMPAYSIF